MAQAPLASGTARGTSPRPTRRKGRFPLIAGVCLLAALVVMALCAPLAGSPYDISVDALDTMGLPVGFGSPGHLFGADALGRDLLSRTLYGLRLTLLIAFLANLTSVGLGTVVGLVAGTVGGAVEQVLMRIVDVFLSVPTILSGLMLASIVGTGVSGIVIVVTALYWAWTARLIHGEALRLRSLGFVEAAAVQGISRTTIIRRHIFPHISTLLLNVAALNGAAVIVIGSGLSFLGAGVQPPTPELGNILDEGAASMSFAPHTLVVPMVMTILAVLSFVLIAEGVTRANPLMERPSWLRI